MENIEATIGGVLLLVLLVGLVWLVLPRRGTRAKDLAPPLPDASSKSSAPPMSVAEAAARIFPQQLKVQGKHANACEDCGYHWQPRGQYIAARCPRCRSGRVRAVV